MAGFGDPNARVLVLGLAPAAHGANRTGRVFTGDGSGDFLMRAMHATGFANIPTSQRSDDGLALTDAWIAAAVRCAPPDNKPTPAEIAACHSHLVAEFDALASIRVIVCLGRIAFDAAWRLLATRGVIDPSEASLRARPRVPPRRRPDCDRFVPSEPSEHQYRKADAADARIGVRTSEADGKLG